VTDLLPFEHILKLFADREKAKNLKSMAQCEVPIQKLNPISLPLTDIKKTKNNTIL
jgi:hypothetical protein